VPAINGWRPLIFGPVRACSKKNALTRYIFLCSVDRSSLYKTVNETNLVHVLFLVYFISFVYNFYMFRTSLGPSSGGTTVFIRHLVLAILYI